ncbi:MAG: hypothetical protein MI919_02160 [Holophagales bacterium]|nr:hypothetical protein [Holophagales bacterium]
MRFEILWLLVRHCFRVIDRAGGGHDPEDLRRRLWNGLPRFGAEGLVLELIALRGHGERVPPAYDRLLEPDHPFRRRAVERLSRSGAEG